MECTDMRRTSGKCHIDCLGCDPRSEFEFADFSLSLFVRSLELLLQSVCGASKGGPLLRRE
jgi:hypothetical protein